MSQSWTLRESFPNCTTKKRHSASDVSEIVLLHLQSNPSPRKADLHGAHGWASSFFFVFVA
jgi:hypothetical protein